VELSGKCDTQIDHRLPTALTMLVQLGKVGVSAECGKRYPLGAEDPLPESNGHSAGLAILHERLELLAHGRRSPSGRRERDQLTDGRPGAHRRRQQTLEHDCAREIGQQRRQPGRSTLEVSVRGVLLRICPSPPGRRPTSRQ